MRPKIEQLKGGSDDSRLTPAELKLVLLLAMVQFVNILDFMMVMPLGPDFSAALDIPTSKIGVIGGSYTAAAAISGILTSFFLDRFPRKTALSAALAGLSAATLAGALSTGLYSLLATRICAGAFGGPATALALAMTADSIPVRKRGRALGIVMGAFSVASIAGVPAGLELASSGGWRAPFFAIGGLGFFIAGAFMLRTGQGINDNAISKHAHKGQDKNETLRAWKALLSSVNMHLSMAIGASAMFSAFIVIPNIAAFVQKNLGYPRENMGMLYLFGGVTSLFTMQIAGRIIDRYDAFRTGLAGTVLLIATVYLGFYDSRPWFSPVLLAVLFMSGSSTRMIAANTIASRVPSDHNRAAFMALQSTTQHVASAAGAFGSSLFLGSEADGKLTGVDRIAIISMIVSVAFPLLMKTLETRLNRLELTA
jgi:predicted MFS family arabinose efflux permease